MPLEYSIAWLACAVAISPDAVMVGLPTWPRRFTWNTSVVGVSYVPGGVRGYARAAGDSTITMRVRVPDGSGPELSLRTVG